MHTVACTLGKTAYILNQVGIHRGDQFADRHTPALDVCAAVYLAAEGALPGIFHTDEITSIDLIERSQPAMDAIRALSAALDTEPCETNGRPDYIEHVSNWAATRAPFSDAPPTTSEVIGRILRAADNHAATPHHHAA
jgi:hypothetical protein